MTLDDLLNNLVVIKEELGDKPATVKFDGGTNTVELTARIQGGTLVRTVVIGTDTE